MHRGQLLRFAEQLAIALVAAFACLPAQLSAQESDDEAPRPNILVFLSDDMFWSEPGFNGGNGGVETPNLDRIADEGVKFSQFYVQPVCSPTRASLLTGRYPWKNGMERRPTFGEMQGMLADERTIAETLRAAGYATWMLGKWHLGHWRHEHLPLQRGFEHHYGFYTAALNSFNHLYGDGLDWHRNGRPVIESGYVTFLLADEAERLIERHDGRRPFFLYMPFKAVHSNHQAPNEYVEQYSHLPNKRRKAMLKTLDVAVGRVLGALERRGMLDDTLVMFLNDNGGGGPAGYDNGPFIGQKGSWREGGVLVPAALRWPREVAAGNESDALLHVTDLYPTFAGLAGADADAGLPLDGLDVWDAIANGVESPREEIVFSSHVIRSGSWKFLDQQPVSFDPARRRPQLYDLSLDPYESRNLAWTVPEKVAELRARIAHHMQSARQPEPVERFPNLDREDWRGPHGRPYVYGQHESETFTTEVKRALAQRSLGNLGPELDHVAVSADGVKLVYNRDLDSGSAPLTDAFTVVLNPGYRAVSVTGVAVSDREVRLTLGQRVGLREQVGVTYAPPLTGAIRDRDGLAANGLTWVSTADVPAGQAPLRAEFEDVPETHAVVAFTFRVRFSAAVSVEEVAVRDNGFAVSGGVVSKAERIEGDSAHWQIEVTPDGGHHVSISLKAGRECGLRGAICTADGRRIATGSQALVLGPAPAPPEVSVAAVSAAVSEGSAASFAVLLSWPAYEDITVPLSASTAGAALTEPAPASLTVPARETRALLSLATEDDALVVGDGAVTVTLSAGAGYALGSSLTASVRVLDDDEATFAVSASPAEIEEGESSTVTVAVTNGVTFTADQEIDLSVSGTVSANDYALSPQTLTLAAGETAVDATLTASADAVMENAETARVSAAHDGAELGAAQVIIAEQLPEVTLSAVSDFVAEGAPARFRVALSAPSSEELAVLLSVSETGAVLSGAAPAWVEVAAGATEAVLSLDTVDDAAAEADGAVMVTLAAGTGYAAATSSPVAAPPAEGDVRLAGGAVASEGRVEIYHDGRWGMVCDDFWGLEDARVACRQLGYPGVRSAPMYGRFGSGEGPIWMDNMVCAGDELRLADCPFNGWGVHNCGTGEEAGAACKTLADVAADPGYTVGTPSAVEVTVLDDDAASAGRGGRRAERDLELPGRVLRGLWSDGDTLWVADQQVSWVYAYGLSDGERRASRDVVLTDKSGAEGARDLWSDGETLWVVRVLGASAAVRGYRLADGTRDASKDLALPSRDRRMGIWGDGSTLWILNRDAGRIEAYRASDGARQESKDIGGLAAAGNGLAWGLWGDGSTLWTADWEDGRLYAYSLSDGTRAPSLDIELLKRQPSRANGLWSDGDTVWVSGLGRQLYAYALPEVSSNASLTLLRATGVDLGSYSPTRTAYSASTGASLSETTLHAYAAAGASLSISPADASDAPGHQVALAEGDNEITVSVTAADGETARSYEVTLTRPTEEDAPAALTASFEEMPSSHTGARFEFRVRFSAPIRTSYRDVRDSSFEVTGGAVDYAKRVNGSSAYWRLKATPSGDGDVTIVLPADRPCSLDEAICAGDGRRLTTRLEATVAGPGTATEPAPPTEPEPPAKLADGDLRLVGGGKESEGRVEVFHYGRWGTVCDDFWGLDDATVACRQLGYVGALEAPRQARFGAGEDPIWMDNVHCTGDETRLEDCLFNGWGVENCAHNEDAGAVCTTSLDAASTAATAAPRLRGPENAAQAASAAFDGPGLTAAFLIETALAGRPAETLEVLDLSERKLPDLWGVERLAGLRVLRLRGNRVSDLSPLAGLSNLRELDLSDNAVVDLSPLVGLRELRRLDISDNRVSDLAPLAPLPSLEVLLAAGNAVADVSPLRPLSTLRRLDLGRNAVSELGPLAALPRLRTLGLRGNAVRSVAALAGLTGLERLDLRDNALEDAGPLAALPSLVWVDIGGNRVHDQSELARRDALVVVLD